MGGCGYWSNHKEGQTGYRLMNLIEQYCGFRYAEDMIFASNGELKMNGEVFAKYQWSADPKNNTPFFKFFGKEAKSFYKNQFILAPFVDKNIQTTYLLQEVRKALSYDDALQVLHFVKLMAYNGEQYDTYLNNIFKKVKNTVKIVKNSYTHYDGSYDFLMDNLKWVAIGAIVDIIPDAIVENGLEPFTHEFLKDK